MTDIRIIIETDYDSESFIEFIQEVVECARDGSLYTVSGHSDGACVLTGKNYEFDRLEHDTKIISIKECTQC